MRILVSGFTKNYGGVETFVMNYYREMKRIDNSIVFDLIGYTPDPAYRKEIEEFGGRVYSVPSVRQFDHGRAVAQFFEEHGCEYDIYWCNKCDLHDIDFLRASSRYIPRRILHAHSSGMVCRGVRNVALKAFHCCNKSLAARLATDYWACSDRAADWIFAASVRDRVRFIPNAIKLKSFKFNESVRNEYRESLGVRGVVFGCIGRINRIKNTAFAIDVFNEIWHRNQNVYLMVVGSDDNAASVKARSGQLPCAKNVLFLGTRRDVSQLLQAMDCLLMPSLFEGFPVAPIEAQAAGLPVFAASDGITPQAELTDLFRFLPLSLGAKGWADHILKADLSRKDRQNVLRKKGFDITLAAKRLIELF